MKKALFIGGTGTISTACVALAAQRGFDVTVLNRGKRSANLPEGVNQIVADMSDEKDVSEKLKGLEFDVVADFIAFTPEQAERDIRLFAGKTGQYIYISSASAYQKPVTCSRITESTPLANPYWLYSRNKIASEDLLMQAYRDTGFPITIVRPSHTYDEKSVPVAVHGAKGSYQVVDRILKDKPVIVHGDGTTWWTLTLNQDFAVGFVGLMGNIHTIGQAFHITSDEQLTWNMIIQIIGAALGKKPQICHVAAETLMKFRPDLEGALIGDKSVSVWFDNSKIKSFVPEFSATTRFDQGVRLCLDAILSHPEYQVLDPEFDELSDKLAAAVDRFTI